MRESSIRVWTGSRAADNQSPGREHPRTPGSSPQPCPAGKQGCFWLLGMWRPGRDPGLRVRRPGFPFRVCHLPVLWLGAKSPGFWDFPGSSAVKNLPAVPETQVQSLGREEPSQKGMATHSTIFAWEIPWTEEPGRLQSLRSQESDTI